MIEARIIPYVKTERINVNSWGILSEADCYSLSVNWNTG